MAEAAGTDRIDLIEAGLDAQVGLLTPDEQQTLGERLAGRFGWRAAGDLAVAKSSIFTLDRDDYDLTLAALADLGVQGGSKLTIPAFEEIAQGLGVSIPAYLGEHAARDDKPELTMHIPLYPRVFTVRKLIAAFDGKQKYSTFVWDDLWNSYTHGDHNDDRGGSRLHAGVMLNDTTDPTDREQKANNYSEVGLVYGNQTVSEQRASVVAEAKQAATQGVILDAATFTDYLVVQAKRRQAGLPLLDQLTSTRFVWYPEKEKDIGSSSTVVPSANVDFGSRLKLSGANFGDAWSGYGVRRVVRTT